MLRGEAAEEPEVADLMCLLHLPEQQNEQLRAVIKEQFALLTSLSKEHSQLLRAFLEQVG